ncbi:MAG: hypothetical protein ACRENS_03260 [Candidatus Eiseniibacteriota bacterium]
MSARRKKPAPRPRAATPARNLKRGASPPAIGVALPALMLVIAAVLIAVAVRSRPQAMSEARAIERMEPEAAYRRALQFSVKRHWRESLPYYRRALEGSPGQEWRPHFNYGVVLNDLTLEFTQRAGVQVPATRSSAERARLGSTALEEFWKAVQLAPDGPTRARILALRANMLVLWGFPWEAFASYRAAERADSTRTDMRERGDQFLALMHDPTRFRFVQPDSSLRLAMP